MKSKQVLLAIIFSILGFNLCIDPVRAETPLTYKLYEIEFTLKDGKLNDTQAWVLLYIVKYLDDKKMITVGTMNLWYSLDQYYQGKYLGQIYLTITQTYLDLVTEYFLSCNIPWGFRNFPEYLNNSEVFEDWESYFEIVPCLMYIDISFGHAPVTRGRKEGCRPIYSCKYYIRSFPGIESYHSVAQYFTNHDEWSVGKITSGKYETIKRIYATKNEARDSAMPVIKEKLDDWKQKEKYRKPFRNADFAKGLDETLSVVLEKVPKRDEIFTSGEWDRTILGILAIKKRLDYYFGEEVALIICKNLKDTLSGMLRTKNGKREFRATYDSLGIH